LGLSNSQYQEIIREYEKRQRECTEENLTRYKEVYKKLPSFLLLEKEIATLSVESGKQLLEGNLDALENYKRKLRALIKEKNQLLRSGDFPDNYLNPIFICKDCMDTGYIDNQKCNCFKKATIELLYEQSNLNQILQRENFNTFSFNYYSTNYVDTKSNLNARELAEDAVFRCKNFIDNFGKLSQNIYIYGNTGVGKTFLLNCIARELIQREHSVLYFTATDLLDILVTSAFNKNDVDANNIRDLIYSCECLIIDDLGTEFTNTAIDAQLFSCINDRLLNQMPVLISSNLSLSHLRERYDDRITSRISGNYHILKLAGEDIRIKMSLPSH
jgi:DNA replication protein DnaC